MIIHGRSSWVERLCCSLKRTYAASFDGVQAIQQKPTVKRYWRHDDIRIAVERIVDKFDRMIAKALLVVGCAPSPVHAAWLPFAQTPVPALALS